MTISGRFDDRTRRVLDEEAAAQGVGTCTFVSQLAEAELLGVRRAAIIAEGAAVAAYLAEHPRAFDDVPDPRRGGVSRNPAASRADSPRN